MYTARWRAGIEQRLPAAGGRRLGRRAAAPARPGTLALAGARGLQGPAGPSLHGGRLHMVQRGRLRAVHLEVAHALAQEGHEAGVGGV